MPRMYGSIIESLVVDQQSRDATLRLSSSSAPINLEILGYRATALVIWRRLHKRFRSKEQELSVPYQLVETPKSYALDALVAATPFFSDRKQLSALAELFAIYYLMVHYFDDHVEHRDKFYSKFGFQEK